MKTEDKDFDPEESLALIRTMIETTKASIKDSSHYFLLWGWATMIGCIIQYVLLNVVHYKHHYYAWFITPVALLIHVFFLVSDHKTEKVKTYISQANSYLWMAIGFSFLVLAFIFSRIGWQNSFPFYILFYGLGTSVSGALLQFKPMVLGGSSCFVLAAFAAYIPYDLQILLTAFAILVSYIIPGHLLRLRHRHFNQNSL
ncbi:MAG: hypothetical protein LH478_12940 [Chitinophagaceae bacterium]|nr:hypothetical protein [Chitinophagaceae bacterium]